MKYVKISCEMRLIKWIPGEAVIIFALFVLFFIFSIFTAQPEEQRIVTHYFSVFEKGPYGLSRLNTVAEQIPIHVESNTRSFIEGVPENIGVIVSIAPESKYTPEEMENLQDWIKEGGVLIYGSDVVSMLDYFDSMSWSSGRIFPLELSEPAIFKKSVNSTENILVHHSPLSPKIEIKMMSSVPQQLSPIFRNVGTIQTPLIVEEDSLMRVYYPEEYLNRELEWYPAWEIPDRVEWEKNYPNSSDTVTDDDDKENWTVLAYDRIFPTVIEKEIGKGRIIAIANPLILANGYIDAADNAVFAMNLLSLSNGSEKCVFDEYHHGVSTEREFRMTSTGWGRSVILILAVCLLAVYSHAVRFIPPRSFPPPERRSQVEYLRSMAQVLRRARALGIVVRIITRDYHGRTQKKEYAKLLNDMKSELRKKRPSESEILNIYQKLQELDTKHPNLSKFTERDFPSRKR